MPPVPKLVLKIAAKSAPLAQCADAARLPRSAKYGPSAPSAIEAVVMAPNQ